jgi:hypothetical protein
VEQGYLLLPAALQSPAGGDAATAYASMSQAATAFAFEHGLVWPSLRIAGLSRVGNSAHNLRG